MLSLFSVKKEEKTLTMRPGGRTARCQVQTFFGSFFQTRPAQISACSSNAAISRAAANASLSVSQRAYVAKKSPVPVIRKTDSVIGHQFIPSLDFRRPRGRQTRYSGMFAWVSVGKYIGKSTYTSVGEYRKSHRREASGDRAEVVGEVRTLEIGGMPTPRAAIRGAFMDGRHRPQASRGHWRSN